MGKRSPKKKKNMKKCSGTTAYSVRLLLPCLALVNIMAFSVVATKDSAQSSPVTVILLSRPVRPALFSGQCHYINSSFCPYINYRFPPPCLDSLLFHSLWLVKLLSLNIINNPQRQKQPPSLTGFHPSSYST